MALAVTRFSIVDENSSQASVGAVAAKNDKAKGADSKEGGTPLPDFIPPSLATLRAQPPDGPGWIHEVKFDGYRIQARDVVKAAK